MKQVFGRYIFILCILISFTQVCEACRFTVREIGFSLLSPTEYSLVVVDDEADLLSEAIQQLRVDLKDSNVRLVLLHTQKDAEHPLLLQAQRAGISFPNAILFGPQENLCPLFTPQNYSFQVLKESIDHQILYSPIRKKILSDVSNTFAYIIVVPGRDSEENQRMLQFIQDDCLRVRDIMSLMPKTVQNEPQVIRLDSEQLNEEKVLLWSLGIDSIPEHASATIIYGRGRYMGTPLFIKEVSNGLVYRYLAMVGADCECNLNRTWMLGTQIPLLWGTATRQALTRSLDFDVDNPLILAEMSRILSKEESGANSTISFTPETIDLDEVFGSETSKSDEQENEEEGSTTEQMLWITLVSLLVVTVFFSLYLLKRREKDHI